MMMPVDRSLDTMNGLPFPERFKIVQCACTYCDIYVQEYLSAIYSAFVFASK